MITRKRLMTEKTNQKLTVARAWTTISNIGQTFTITARIINLAVFAASFCSSPRDPGDPGTYTDDIIAITDTNRGHTTLENIFVEHTNRIGVIALQLL